MKHPPVKVGVIGAGAIGRRVLQAFAGHADMQVRTVCDLNPDVARQTAEPLGAAHTADYRDLLRDGQIDLVYVAVPPRHHHRMVLDVIGAGKHILCEKPLALTLAEAREMAAAAASRGVVHAMNFPLHRAPGVAAFLKHLADGYLGQLRRVELNLVFPRWPRDWQQNEWIGGREQGGAVRECCPHLFHVILRAFGPVAAVQAHVTYPPDDPRASETAAAGVLELASGHTVSVGVLCNVPRPEQVSLTAYGSRGTLGLTNWATGVGARGEGPLEPLPTDPPAGTAFGGLADQLVRAVRGEPGDLVGFDAGVEVQRVLEAWERSSVDGGRKHNA